MILALKTDQPEAELFLLNQESKIIAHYHWLAGRSLADTLITKIDQFLVSQKLGKDDLVGLVVFTGSGSFTGLRIGATVVNALAYNLKLPVVKASGDDWLKAVAQKLELTQIGDFVVPDYDGEPNITKPKK